jgi:putative spermidine/putrescine transport system permease protein
VRFLADSDWQRAIWVSLQVAAITTVLSTAIGFLAALALVRATIRGKMMLYGFLLTPLIVPNIITAIGFYMTFAKMGASGSIVGIALGHTVLAVPLVVIILTGALRNLDERYERAALSLGASQLYTWRRIMLPLAAPSLVSAALFAFLSSFDELLIALFLSGVRSQTLSVRIWNSITLQVEPTIAAVSAFFIVLTVFVLALNALLSQRLRLRRAAA